MLALINIEYFETSDAVGSLSSEQREFFVNLCKQMRNNCPLQMIMIIIAQKGLLPCYPPITEETRKALVDSLMEALPISEHKKYKRILYWVGWDNEYKPYS